MINQTKGVEAEEFVMQYFRNRGFIVDHIDDYYDIEIEKNNKRELVEIKSCQFRVKDGGISTRYGRFQFDKKSSRIKQRKNNIKIIFVISVGDSFEIIGMKSAKSLNLKGKYVPLKSLMDMHIFHIDTYINFFNS